jgi:hypothetical protein
LIPHQSAQALHRKRNSYQHADSDTINHRDRRLLERLTLGFASRIGAASANAVRRSPSATSNVTTLGDLPNMQSTDDLDEQLATETKQTSTGYTKKISIEINDTRPRGTYTQPSKKRTSTSRGIDDVLSNDAAAQFVWELARDVAGTCQCQIERVFDVENYKPPPTG